MFTIEKLELNRGHIWGTYHELRINPECIQRTVYIEEGGMNSLHRHHTSEWMSIISGEIEFTIGDSAENLVKHILAPGDTIFVPANYWHRIRYVSGDFILPNDTIKCAVLNETMLGEHFDGEYRIERLDPAIPSMRHTQQENHE